MTTVAEPVVEPVHDARFPQPEGHRCEARIVAPCSICGTAYPLCNVSVTIVPLILAHRWVCAGCEVS